ncbi:MAG: hypothetical protein ACQKBV_12390, partial [Puniceicoccales bacterium]
MIATPPRNAIRLTSGELTLVREAAAVWREWSRQLPLDDDGWLPVGRVGLTLILGHTDAGRATLPVGIPEAGVQRMILPGNAAHNLRERLDAADLSSVQVKAATHTEAVISTDSLTAWVRGCLQCLPLLDGERATLTRLSEQASVAEADLPEALRLSWLNASRSAAVIDLRSLPPSQAPTEDLVSPAIRSQYAVEQFFADDDACWFATAQWPWMELEDRLAAKTRGREARLALAPESAIRKWSRQRRNAGHPRHDRDEPEFAQAERRESAALVLDRKKLAHFNPRAIHATASDIIEWSIAKAIEMEASDIHFEQLNGRGRIRVRVDGELRELWEPSIAMM